MARRLLTADGKPRPKGKPRGNPQAIVAYKFKPGHQLSRGRRVRISEEVKKELGRIQEGMPQGEALARNLVERAKKDSTELERVIRITEPHLLREDGGMAAGAKEIAFRVVYADPSPNTESDELTESE